MDQLCDSLQLNDHQGLSFAYQSRCCMVSKVGIGGVKHMQYCLANLPFTMRFNAEATEIIRVAVSNFILADFIAETNTHF